MSIVTYKYRIKDKSQVRRLCDLAWRVNQVWNYCVEFNKTCINFWPSHYDFNKFSNETRKKVGLLSDSKDEVCRKFTQNRNAHGKIPKFRASGGPKKKLGWIPFHGRTVKISGDTIKYQGRIFRFWKHRDIPGKIKTGAFVEDAQGKWYVTFSIEDTQRKAGKGFVGIDLGLKSVATCSDGYKIKNNRHTKEYAEKLAAAQRARNKKRVKAIHAKIKNSRKHFLHVESAKIARENKTIIVGDVNSSKLAKTKMSKSVYDAGWYMFKSMLAYKARRHGARFLVVNETFTTQTCSACGSKTAEQRPKGIAGLGIREWVCDCGAVHDRDVNSALNILALGRERAPLAGESRAA